MGAGGGSLKKRKVELFASNELEFLEGQMNDWIAENSNCHIIDVRFAGTGTAERVELLEPVFEVVYTAIIFYEVQE